MYKWLGICDVYVVSRSLYFSDEVFLLYFLPRKGILYGFCYNPLPAVGKTCANMTNMCQLVWGQENQSERIRSEWRQSQAGMAFTN
jgi:hypothetical protein